MFYHDDRTTVIIIDNRVHLVTQQSVLVFFTDWLDLKVGHQLQIGIKSMSPRLSCLEVNWTNCANEHEEYLSKLKRTRTRFNCTASKKIKWTLQDKQYFSNYSHLHELWLDRAKVTSEVCFASSPHDMDPFARHPSPLGTSAVTTAWWHEY